MKAKAITDLAWMHKTVRAAELREWRRLGARLLELDSLRFGLMKSRLEYEVHNLAVAKGKAAREAAVARKAVSP